jgi:superoxide dismutase, Fe-Mn family
MDTSNHAMPIEAQDLHTLQLTSQGGDGQTMEPACALALQANFGSFERWREQFAALAARVSQGRALLVFRPNDGSLANVVCADDSQAAAAGVPLLALKLGEPAAPPGLAADAGANVDAFTAHIHWPAVYARYVAAVHAASEPWAASSIAGATVIDVRRAGVFANAKSMIPGAAWKDPAEVAHWATELPQDAELVVYCVYGHEVGRATAMRLRAAGLNARYLTGGIDGWQSAGLPLADK